MTETPLALDHSTLLAHTTTIVAAQVSQGSVSAEQLPALIKAVYTALTDTHTAEQPAPPKDEPVPAVPIKKSVFPDYIICLEDGKKLKMLKRHLQAQFNMTPEQYRERWNLPHNYPLVAPNYGKRRSELAKTIGLGRAVTAHKRKAT